MQGTPLCRPAQASHALLPPASPSKPPSQEKLEAQRAAGVLQEFPAVPPPPPPPVARNTTRRLRSVPWPTSPLGKAKKAGRGKRQKQPKLQPKHQQQQSAAGAQPDVAAPAVGLESPRDEL